MTCSSDGDVTDSQSIIYRKSNYEDEWYMITREGLSVSWDNEADLGIVAEKLRS